MSHGSPTRSEAVRFLAVAYFAKALGVQGAIAFRAVLPLKLGVKRRLGIRTPTRVVW